MGFMINLFAGCSLPVISKSKYTSFLQLRICCECCLNGHKNDVIWSRNFITTKGYLEDSSNPIKTRSETGNRLEKRHKLSKKVRKTIMSIERLYKPSTNTEVCPKPEITEDIDLPPADEADTAILESDGNYEHVQNLVKKIYKSATSHVYNDALWKRYVQQLQVIIPLLRPSDLCLVLYSFGKIKFKDKKLLKVLFPQIIRNMSNFTCMGLSLILNSLKCLETPNYDIIDLVANQICLNMDKANMQDITLIANSLSYFHIYHLRFWNSLSSSLSLRHHQITPLQSSLLVAAMAKLDIRVPFILGILKSKLYPSVDKNELPSNLLTLVMHSFAKLEFDARNFYSLCVSSFGNILLERPEQVDGQSHVLFLYASVCLLEPEHQIVENSLRYISTKSEYLNNYKTIKLKAVVDFLDYKYPDFVNNLDEKLKSFINTLKSTKTKKIERKLSRWAIEVSRLLEKSGVKHKRNVLFDYIYVDIYMRDFNVAIKCTGPYSYYASSTQMTAIAKAEHMLLSLKGFNVFILPYYEWNSLKTEEDKMKYLSNFGKIAASSISAVPWSPNVQ